MSRKKCVEVWTLFLAMVPSSALAQEQASLLATFPGPVSAIVILGDGDRILVGSQGALHRVDRQGTILKSCGLPIQQLTSLTISTDGKTVWAGGGDPGVDGQVVAIDTELLEVKHPHDLHDDVISSLAISPDGKRIITSSIDQNLRILDLLTGVSLDLRGHSKAVTGVDWIDDRLAVSVAEDMSVRVWDVNEKQLVRTMNQHVGAVLGVMMLDGAESLRPVIATWGKDRTIRFWQPTIGRMMRFASLDGIPMSACWNSRDGQLLIGDNTGSVSGIDWESGKVLATKKVSEEWIVALSQDSRSGQVFAGTSSGELLRFSFPAPNGR